VIHSGEEEIQRGFWRKVWKCEARVTMEIECREQGGVEAARVSWGVVVEVTSIDLHGGRMERMIMGRV
jgi:hypothetical protein